VGKELYDAAFDSAVHKLVHCVVAEGDTVYVPAVVGSVANDVPGVEFSEQTNVVPPCVTWIDFTVLSDDPTWNVPGLVIVKVPLENVQLSDWDPLRINISAVPAPNVTPGTVILLFATKSFVAAKTTSGKNSDRIVRSFFNIEGKVLQ
jgi:hypothetical protein